MIAKELLDARWKALPGLLFPLLVLVALGSTGARDVDAAAMIATTHRVLAAHLSRPAPVYEVWVWHQAFGGGPVLVAWLVAAALGAGLIAGEAGKGTILFLLSRPVGRDRVLLTKYAVCAALLGGVAALVGAVALLVAALRGHPLPAGGVLLSVVLLWLQELFVLGLATAYSVIARDALRPALFALLTGAAVVTLPSYVVFVAQLPARLGGATATIGNGPDAWSLATYWANLDAFAGNAFPLRALLIAAIGAAIPLAIALGLFRRQAY
jgi:ABC-type transport system involved in multi-copper enzyme maturation permease subunit